MKFIPIVLLLFVIAGCSRITAIGGHFDVEYPTDVAFENFNKPIVVGHKMRLFVRKVASDDGLPVQSVKIHPAHRAQVLEVSGNQFVIQTKEAGPFKVLINSVVDGRTVTDRVTMHALPPRGIKWAHACDENAPVAVYPVGESSRLPALLFSKRGAPMIGIGAKPVNINSKVGARIVPIPDDQSGITVRADREGEAQLVSPLSSTTLNMKFAAVEKIDGLGLNPFDEGMVLWEGGEALVSFVPKLGAAPFCGLPVPLEVRTDGPCSVSTKDEEGRPIRNGFVRVFGNKRGICNVHAKVPGTAASAHVKIPIGSFPSPHDAEFVVPRFVWPLVALVTPLMMFPVFARRLRRRR